MSTAAAANRTTPMDSTSALDRIKAALSSLSGLDEVEALIRSKLVSESPLLEAIPTYLLELGGKRMRPLLALLTAQLFGQRTPSEQVIAVASGIELIHMATLLHDDIIDRSPMRRHKSSPYAKFGMCDTLLSGDFLLTRAFSLCARLDPFIIDATELACIELTEGEIAETSVPLTEHTVESSLTIARKKTASLFRLAAESGAHLSGASTLARSKMREFGETLGIAFQILDDILDVTSTEDLLGKQAGMDIKERKPAIVNVLWLARGSELSKRLLTGPSNEDDAWVQEALAEVRQSPVIDEARDLARTHSERARKALEQASRAAEATDPRTLDYLHALVDFTLERMV